MSAKRFPQKRLPVIVYGRQQRSLYTAPVVSGNPRNGPTIQSTAPRILADAGKGSELDDMDSIELRQAHIYLWGVGSS